MTIVFPTSFTLSRLVSPRMKFHSLLLPLLILLSACSVLTPRTPTPSVSQIAATSFPTLPLPTATQTSTVTPLPPTPTHTHTSIPPTRTSAPPPTEIAKRAAPEILGQFKVLDLPGEGRAPSALALLQKNMYVANRASANIGIIADDRVRAFIPLGVNPSALVADATGNRIYAATYETPTLFLIENDRITKQIAAGGRVNALALDGDMLYVALDSEAIIERYDANSLTKKDQLKLAQGFGVSDLVVDKERNRLYAAVYGKIVALDLAAFQELFTLNAPYLYNKFAVNPADGSIWSGVYDDQSSRPSVVGYNPDGQEIARLFLGADLQAATFDDVGRLYVLDRFNNQVHIIQTPQAQLVATVAVNEAPSDAVFDAARKVVYVANQENDNVSVIDLAALRVIATIPLANNITALASNPTRNRVYAANASTNSVFVIEGARVVGQVQTGNNPVDLAVDEKTNRLYVASRADGALTVIDENKLEITASQFITRFLSTVAVDSENKKLFAGNTLLDPETLKPVTTFFAQGLTLNSQTSAQYARVNPALKKLYALASNGVPGSNARVTLFRFLYDDLAQSELLGSKNSGNTTALAIDATTNNVFAANFHPLAYSSGLDVFDSQDKLAQSLALASRTTALVVNPATHHLFLSHAQTFRPTEREPQPRDNTIEILDTRTLGHVATLEVANDPTRMTLLNDQIYVASFRDGMITIIGDAETNQPPAPTPTLTLTPFPTMTFTPPPTATNIPASTPTNVAIASDCTADIAEPLRARVQEIGRAKIGCPTRAGETSDKFALQPFASGFMFDDFRDANAKQVTVLFPNKTWRVFPDTWRDGDEDKQCDVYVKPGLWRPKRGFGSVWCNEADVQALGGGLAEERSVMVTLQTFERGKILYFPDFGIFALFDDGTWE